MIFRIKLKIESVSKVDGEEESKYQRFAFFKEGEREGHPSGCYMSMSREILRIGILYRREGRGYRRQLEQRKPNKKI